MSTIAGRWDDYSLGIAIQRHWVARDDARERIEAIDDEIRKLEDEQRELTEVANRHYNAVRRLEDVRRRMRMRLSEPASDMSDLREFASTLALMQGMLR